MMLRYRWLLAGVLALGTVSASLAAPAKNSKAKPAPAITVADAKAVDANMDAKPIAKDSSKQSLGDGFIAQNTLRVYLERPVSISVFNVRGQLVFRQDSERPLEIIPLSGMPTGFLYLTLRSGKYELTKKLVYTGK